MCEEKSSLNASEQVLEMSPFPPVSTQFLRVLKVGSQSCFCSALTNADTLPLLPTKVPIKLKRR